MTKTELAQKMQDAGAFLPGKRVKLDTTAYADGVYTAIASAVHGGLVSTSQPRTVYVLNGPLNGKIAFTNVTAGQVLDKGSFIFEIASESTPVPFNKVTFRAKNAETGLEIKRSTPNVAAKMAINWRMKDVPSGDYDVTIEGAAGDTLLASAPIRVKIVNP